MKAVSKPLTAISEQIYIGARYHYPLANELWEITSITKDSKTKYFIGVKRTLRDGGQSTITDDITVHRLIDLNHLVPLENE